MKVFLYILGYIIIGIITTIALNKLADCDKSDSIGWGIFWPLVWIFYLALLFTGLFMSGIEWLGDRWEDLERKHKTKK